MVFSSLLFIYGFLPLNLLCYCLAKDIRTKNMIMLIFSLIFYAWGEPVYVLLLVGMTLANWLIALKVDTSGGKKKKLWLIFACVVSIGTLGVFKYGSFTLENIQLLFGVPEVIPNIILPIGISFYTFQILSYVVDVYRGEVAAQKSFFHVLLYTSLFHQCIAGPIIRYKDVSDEIFMRHAGLADISGGISRFVAGLGKKVILANACGLVADDILLPISTASDLNLLSENLAVIEKQPAALLWLGVMMYALQIYLDFSAYSDMAIGMGRMLGFHYKENFDYPYTSGSVQMFWRKWHISLGSFFRDYVYIPMGGSRNGKVKMFFAMLTVWFLTGLWHGASWNFVLWGLYYFVFLLIERIFLGKVLKKIPRIFGIVYTLAVVIFGWILFRFESMELLLATVKGMFMKNSNVFINFEAETVLKNNASIAIVSAFACVPLVKAIIKRLKQLSLRSGFMNTVYGVLDITVVLVILLLSTAALVGDSYNPFIYFQF